jgi:hypothetical protein
MLHLINSLHSYTYTGREEFKTRRTVNVYMTMRRVRVTIIAVKKQ